MKPSASTQTFSYTLSLLTVWLPHSYYGTWRDFLGCGEKSAPAYKLS